MFSLEVQVRDIHVHMAENVHKVVVDKRAPGKVSRVVDFISSEVELAKNF